MEFLEVSWLKFLEEVRKRIDKYIPEEIFGTLWKEFWENTWINFWWSSTRIMKKYSNISRNILVKAWSDSWFLFDLVLVPHVGLLFQVIFNFDF